jgi:hypothetical protein
VTGRVPPHDLGAEASILGACLVHREPIEVASRLLTPDDFYKSAYGQTFAVIVGLHSQGRIADHVTVGPELDRLGILPQLGGVGWATTLMSSPAGVRAESVQNYAETVVKHSTARRALQMAAEAVEALYTGQDPYDVSEGLSADLGGIDRVGVLPAGFSTYGEFLDSEVEADSPWVIPGLVYEDTRVVLTASGGAGKSTFLRQIVWCAAMGIHPFTFTPIPQPVPSVILDFENPRRELRTTGFLLRNRLSGMLNAQYDESRVGLWRRPQGGNIRDRAVRSQLEAVLEAVHPKLVVGGPVYKLSRKKSGENYEELADATHEILDDMRIRHGFALILEHHATVGKNGKDERDLRSFGGQRWEAWPDIAIALRKRQDGIHIERPSREDRGVFQWPEVITRGKLFPWEATYAKGTFRSNEPPPRDEPADEPEYCDEPF